MVPSKDFTPLRMQIGETWSFYVCMSNADLRYALGTSIGTTFSSNSELRIMEGAGAADYPPFMGGTPESGGVEYTFYAPRVFTGSVRYDYVAECSSAAPSMFDHTPVPTPVPVLSTTVSYTFYVEHSQDKLMGAVTYDMGFGVRAVLDRLLAGDDDLLTDLAVNDALVLEQVSAIVVSPSLIGCELLIGSYIIAVGTQFSSSHTHVSPPLRSVLSNSARDMHSHLRRCHCHAPFHGHTRRGQVRIATSIRKPPRSY